MKILFYSDPHIGLSRQSNTTPASAERLKQALLETPLKAIKSHEDIPAICLGDLFDSYSNSEGDIIAGSRLAEATSYVLAGNHDIAGREDRLSSFQLLADLLTPGNDTRQRKLIYSNYGETKAYPVVVGASLLVFVPHTATSELFEEALQKAEAEARSNSWCTYKVLCLHCNYDLGEGLVKSNTTLNLTQERAYRLLSHFHRVLIGHEHAARQDPNTDRIQLLGSTHPTSLADVSDKWYWLYDTNTGELTRHLLWSAEEHSYAGPLSQLPDREFQFYDLSDDLPPGAGTRLVNKLFASQTTLAVRLRSKDRQITADAPASAEDFGSLPDIIEQELAKSEPRLLALFREYRHAAETESN